MHPSLPDPLPAETPSDRTPAPVQASLHPRLVAAAEVLLCSGLPTQLVLLQLLSAIGWAPGPGNLRPLLALLVADTGLLIVLMVMLLRTHGERASALWLGSRRLRTETLLGLWLIPVVFLMVVVMLNALRLWLPWLHNVPVNPLETLAGTGTADAALFGLVAILAGGVREEMQRAFLLHRFEQHLGGAAVGVVVLSAAFGLGHAAQGWDAVVTTAVLGAFWAIVYLRRRSSVAPVISHAGFNGLEVVRVAMGGGS